MLLCASTSHANDLRTRGYTVLPSPIISASHADRLATTCGARLSSLLAEAREIGYDPTEQSYQFSEICHRERMRWDLRIKSDDSWQKMCEAAMAAATPLIREASAFGDGRSEFAPRLAMSGAVVSRTGARMQRFHADASEEHFAAAAADPSIRLFTCFVPLVDIAADGDGTQFWPGSHFGEGLDAARRGIASDGRLKWERDNAHTDEPPPPVESPACPKGGMIAFDYRVLHRGLPSIGRDRPVAYVVISTCLLYTSPSPRD